MKSKAHEFASPDMLVLEYIFPDVDVVHELEYEAKGKTGRRVDADEGNEAIVPEPIAGDSLVTEPLQGISGQRKKCRRSSTLTMKVGK